jgi:sugar phosphate isomerase/epimerase
MIRKLGFLAGLNFIDLRPEEVTHILAQEGYQGISWPLVWFDPRKKSDQDRKNLVAAVEKEGLQVTEWVAQIDYVTLDKNTWSDRIKHTIEIIQGIGRLGSKALINLFTGPAPWDPYAPRLTKDISEGSAWDLVIRAFDQLITAAENENVILAVEPVFGHLVHDYYSMMELFRRFDSPNLKVNFDPSHGILYQNDTGWVIKQLGDKIVHCHLKDSVGRPGGLPGETFQFPLLGEGEVPWNEFKTSLDEIGYSGFLTVEFESFNYYKQVLQSDPRLAARRAMDDVKMLGLLND